MGVSMCVYIHIYIYLFIYVYNNTVYIYTDIPKREQRQNIPMDETGQLIEVYSATIVRVLEAPVNLHKLCCVETADEHAGPGQVILGSRF